VVGHVFFSIFFPLAIVTPLRSITDGHRQSLINASEVHSLRRHFGDME